MPDADLVVEVPIDAPPAVVTEKEPEPKQEAKLPPIEPVADLKKQFEELSARQADDRRAAETARADADKAAADAKAAREETAKLRTERDESNVSAVDNAIAAAKAEADGFQREQQTAFETGDFAKASEFGRKMANAEARVGRLEDGKADLQALKPEPRTEPAKPTQADPFETAISGATPRAQKWLRGHPTFVTDPNLNRKANIAHLKAIDEGHVIDSDAYYDFCERELGLKEAPKQPETRRTASMPAAPVSRETTPSGGSLTPTQVTLSPGEQQRATDGTLVWNYNDPKLGAVKGQPIGIKEMARRKMSMQKEGRYGVLSDS